jgi:catalase
LVWAVCSCRIRLAGVKVGIRRLGGPNYEQIPVNAPRCPMANMQRDGHMTMIPQKGRVSYSPSSLESDSPRQDPANGFTSFHALENGDKLRVRAESFGDHFSQALMFFNSQTEPEQNHIISAFIFELSKVETKAVRTRMLGQLANVSPEIAQRVANGLGTLGAIKPVPTKVPVRTDLPTSDALSILKKAVPGLKTKVIGCLIGDGSDAKAVLALRKAASAAGANLKVVAPKIGEATASDGTIVEADFQLAGGCSVLFDAVFVLLSKEGATKLSTEGAAVAWVHDAFVHLKVIGASSAAKPVLDAASVVKDAGIVIGDDHKAYLKKASEGRIWNWEPSVRSVF